MALKISLILMVKICRMCITNEECVVLKLTIQADTHNVLYQSDAPCQCFANN